MFDNTLKLTKFMLKREKVTSTAWVLTMVMLNFLIFVMMGASLMPEASDRLEFMAVLENPAMLVAAGQGYGYQCFENLSIVSFVYSVDLSHASGPAASGG